MGAWDTTIYGNDAACDWLAELLDSDGWALVDEALDVVLGAGDDVIESSTGEEALAAADVVAWVNGRPGREDEATEGLGQWIEDQELEADERRVKRALRAVDRVFNDPSELKDGWEDAGESEFWRRNLTDLKKRLRDE